MIQALRQNWWTLALRGVVAIVFGILAFMWPTLTALAFVVLLAAFAFIEGIFALGGAFGWGLPGSQRLLLVLIGLFGLAVGVIFVLYPAAGAYTIVIWVAWWAIITGALQIVIAVEMRKAIQNEWLLVTSALLSILFGILLIWRPAAGVITLVWLFGFYAIVYGLIMLGLGFRLRSAVTQ